MIEKTTFVPAFKIAVALLFALPADGNAQNVILLDPVSTMTKRLATFVTLPLQ